MKEIRVGILHSLSGSMASSEMPLVDAALFAIDEINKQGGVLGKQLLGVVEDGCSNPGIFKSKAAKLLKQDGVHVISGCWTSSSRKAVQEIIQDNNAFLLYPVQYEGLEENPDILYSGSCLNQQITPAIEWCLAQGYENFYLVGSDYVFPKTANALTKSLLLDRGANILGEDYLPLGATDFKDMAKSIALARPDFVISTINGDSNAAFFTHYNKSGNEYPVMSFSIAEHDLHNLGIQNAAHYLCWSYFHNLDNKVNQRFLRDFGRYNKTNPIASDPVVMTYSQILLWSQAVEEAGSLDIEAVRTHLHGQRLNSPAGLLEVMPNNHIIKSAFIGRQVSDKKFEVIWKSDKCIKPEPWLGMEEVKLPSVKLALDALAQYPNLIHLNTALQTANLELKEAKRELEKYREHLEELVQERTAELAASEERLKVIFEAAPDAIYLIDLKGNFLDGNKTAEDMLGYKREELIGKSILRLKLLSAKELPKAAKALAKSVLSKKTGPDEFLLHRKDGSQFPVEIITYPVKIKGKTVVLGIARDISERKKADEVLRRSEASLAEAQRMTHIGNWELDLISNTLTWSDEIYRMFGLEPRQFGATYEAFLDNIHPDDREMVNQAYTESVNSRVPYNIVHRLLLKDGTLKYVNERCKTFYDEKGKPIRSIGMVQDITERKQAEKDREELQTQLQQSQKMEVVGRLAGGIAHDFNNMLTVIMGYSQMLLSEKEEGDAEYADIKEIQKAGKSAASLTSQLLLFSRKQPIYLTVININEAVMDMGKMLKRVIGEDIELQTELGKDLDNVKADPGQIEQVVMNLAINARDAMPDGGKLSITTQMADIDKLYAELNPEAKSGRYNCITIEDTGTGIDNDTLKHIFEPFYTTKEAGKGTGLGLSVVFGIIKQHGGWINVYSEVGKGTAFKIYLPSIPEGVDKEKDEEAKLSELKGNGETILVVEDEDGVREFTKKVLEQNGYTVIAATTAKEGLEIFEREKGNIDLVFSDVVLPDMNGIKLVKEMSSHVSKLNYILCSGYAQNNHNVITELQEESRYIHKPYSIIDLLKIVKRALS